MHLSILAVLLLCSGVSSEDPQCVTEIQVRRHTSYTAGHGQYLRINCTVKFCKTPPPVITWHKMMNQSNVPQINTNSTTHIKSEWKYLTNSTGISYLIFENILMSDTGTYRCEDGETAVSHFINVSVFASVQLTTVTWRNESTDADNREPDIDTLWWYVYAAAGILLLVILVITISVLSMRRCRGESRKNQEPENQYIAIPMSHQTPPHPNLQPHPRGFPPSHHPLPDGAPESIYDNAPPQQPARKQPAVYPRTSVSGDNGDIHGQKKRGQREEKRKKAEGAQEDEESTVVYAALNHEILPGASARPLRPTEESSEYAAIVCFQPQRAGPSLSTLEQY